MNSEKALFELVHSMHPSEIRYFRKYSQLITSSKTGKKRYMEDFEAILKMPKFTPERWKYKVTKKDSSSKAKASQSYLYKLVLDILSQQNHNQNMELLDLVKQIEVLYHKKLNDQALVKIKTATEIAESLSRFGILSRIKFIEALINSNSGAINAKIERGASLYKERIEVYNKLKNLVEYEHEILMQSNLILTKHGSVRTLEDKIPFENLLNHELLKSKQKALSNKALLAYYNSKIVALKSADYFLESSELAYEAMQELKKIGSGNDNFVYKLMPLLRYTESLFACLRKNIGVKVDLKTKIESCLEELNNLSKTFVGISQTKCEMIYYILKITLHNDLEEHLEIEQLLKGIDKEFLSKWSRIDSSFPKFLIEMVKYQLAIKDYDAVDASIQRFYDLEKKVRLNELITIKFIELLVHFEQSNFLLVSQKAASLEKFLRRKEKLYSEELILLNLLKKCAIFRPKELKQAIDTTRKKLLNYPKENSVANFNSTFNYDNWLSKFS